MAPVSPIVQIVRSARRRRFLQAFLDGAALALAIVLAGFILLLLAGNDVLDWRWLILVAIAALGVAVYRANRNAPSAYQMAQALDERLGFHDALSTALYFGERPAEKTIPHEAVAAQLAAAEKTARTADLRRGVPFVLTRNVYLSSILAAAAIGAFGIRYGVTRTLDLRPSLVKIAFESFATPPQESKTLAKNKRSSIAPSPSVKDGELALEPWQSKALDEQSPSNEALKTVEVPDGNGNQTGAPKDKASGPAAENSPGTPGETGENGEKSADSRDGSQNSGNAQQNAAKREQGAPDGSNQNANTSGGNSSLADKMRDALANLMSKLRSSSSNQSASKQGSSPRENGKQGATQAERQSKESSGADSAGKPQNNATGSADSQSDANSQQSAANAQSAPGKGNSKDSDPNKSADAKSGVGRQDGDKSAKEAEQLAAMGKISEIIGKRSANISGEMMVEVPSGKQQLKTQYSQRKATHMEAGGEINRDEVPLAYQQYVQQYFEEIRKMTAAKAHNAGDKTPDNKKPSS